MKTKESVFDMPSNRIMNCKEASEYLGVTVGHIYNLKNTGVLKAKKVGPGKNGSLRFEKSYLEEFIRGHNANKEIRQ
jgi:excisionase family DNA binding protein